MKTSFCSKDKEIKSAPMKDTLAVKDKNIPREVKASGARWEMIAVWHTLH